MKFTTVLARFDNLILQHTKGSGTAALRGRLFVVQEHAEAFERDFAKIKNAHTVAKNQLADALANLEEQKKEFDAQKNKLNAKIDGLEKKNAMLSKEVTELRDTQGKNNTKLLREKLPALLDLRYHKALGVKPPKRWSE